MSVHPCVSFFVLKNPAVTDPGQEIKKLRILLRNQGHSPTRWLDASLLITINTSTWYVPMFGIGLPEMIVIFAVALIVVGPDKLPGLARSLAKGLVEMKKTMHQVKDSLTEEGEELNAVQKDLRQTADELKAKMLDSDPSVWEMPSRKPSDKPEDADTIDLQPVPSPQEDEAKEISLPVGDVEQGTTDKEPPQDQSSSQPGNSQQDKEPATRRHD